MQTDTLESRIKDLENEVAHQKRRILEYAPGSPEERWHDGVCFGIYAALEHLKPKIETSLESLIERAAGELQGDDGILIGVENGSAMVELARPKCRGGNIVFGDGESSLSEDFIQALERAVRENKTGTP